MGEYAEYNGQQVKIGTCESMYYLRADQAHDVRPLSGNVNPVTDRESIRFRFPFPAEDYTAPGDFEYPLPAVVVNYPAELYAGGHGTVSVQTADHGPRRLSAALPCPTVAPEIWHQYVQSYRPAVRIAYQGYRGDKGHLAVIVECAYCDGTWSLPDKDDADLLAVSIRSQADALNQAAAHRRQMTLQAHGPNVGDSLADSETRQSDELHIIADRILAGYTSLAVAPS